MNDLIDRDAERSVVGAILTIPDTIADVADWLPPEAFGDSRCRAVYRAMSRLWERRVPSDPITVAAELRAMKPGADQAVIDAFLADLRGDYFPGAWATHHADLILAMARRRTLVERGAELVKAAHEGEPDLDETLVAIRRDVEAFLPSKPEPETVADQVDDLRDTTLRRWSGEWTEAVVPTGIRPLDRLTYGGMRPQDLIVIGARPSMGKTSFMLHIAKHARSIVFSLEMPKHQILNRLICAEAGVPYGVAMSEIGDVAHQGAWLDASRRVEAFPLTVVDTPDITTAKIEAMVERRMAEDPIDAVFVDHLGYLGDRVRANSEQEKTGELIRRCKLGARRTNVPWVVLTQLNRDVESRPGCIPYMSDIRSSGKVEEDADVVALLYRRAYYASKGMVAADDGLDRVLGTGWDRLTVNICKNRNGDTGGLELGWHPASMSIHEIERRSA